MIDKIGEVMLYVNDLKGSRAYWTEVLDFKVIEEDIDDPVLPWIKVAPRESSETGIVLMNKAMVAKMSPELNLETPSLMFFSKSETFEQLYKKLLDNNANVGEMTQMPSTEQRVFNFSDKEDHYFAVLEQLD